MTKNWRKTGYLIPDEIEPEENICICVPVPKDWGHINAFLGQITQLAKWLTWEKDGTDSAIRTARRWMEITECVIQEVNNAMASNCGCGSNDPVIYRFNPDTGRLEQSADGGATWTEAPDPRWDSPLLPPVVGGTVDDTKCLAAANAVEFFKTQLIDQATGWTTFTAFVAGVIAIIAAILTGGIAAVLVAELVSTFIGVGIAAAVAAFTSEVYERFKCNLYCHAQDDGSWTEADIAAIRAQLDIDETAAALSILQSWLDQLGPAGLTNSGRLHLITDASCDDCACDNFCSEKYRIFDNNPAFGTILEFGPNYIIAECTGQPLTLQAIDYNDCCYVTAGETLSGGTIFSAFELCGAPPVPPWIGATPIGNCCSIIECQIVGTIKIFFDVCP